jgi:hypothetical protein
MNRWCLAAVGMLASAHATVAAPPASHCSTNEDTLFTCRMGKKTLSFCAAKSPEGTTPPWIQYRFGQLGKPELVYPEGKSSPVGHFRFTSQKGGRWVDSVVEFSNGGYSYVLRAYGNSSIPESDASLLVVSPDGSRKVLGCADPGLYAAAGLYPFEMLKLEPVPKDLR